MKTKLKLSIAPVRHNRFPRSLIATSLLALAALSGQQAQAADIQWTGAASGGNASTIWTNVLNWSGGVVPGSGDNALFNSTFTGNPITINVNPLTVEQVGSVTMGTGVAGNFSIKCQSGATAITTLNLNGGAGILLSNISSSYQIGFVATNTVNNNLLNLGVTNGGLIFANYGGTKSPIPDGAGGEILITCIMTGPGNITNIGPGVLFFGMTNNSYTGSTTLANGVLELNGTGTIGNGTGPLIFSGGQLESANSRASSPISNPIVINTATNAYIYNSLSANANSTRVFPLSGSLGGTSGTLVLGDPQNVNGNQIFDVQLLGTFTFNLPLVAGDNLGDPYSDALPGNIYTELQLANSTATGAQTFNGSISGDGPIFRGNAPSGGVTGDNGVTIFTASNSYTGGTVINNGTLFANNTAGSALGSGSVVVTNTGILAGNGFVLAPTTIGGVSGGTIQPGTSATTVGVLNMDGGLTFNPGATYTWQMSSATGTAGTAWDLITCTNGWTDAGGSPAITINVTSVGVPTGWNANNSYSWVIITNNALFSPNFNSAHWTVSTTGFGGSLAGVFGTTTDANGDLILTYTHIAGSVVIDVESGSLGQESVTPINYPVLTGATNVIKVGNGEVIMDNSLNSYAGQTFIDAGTASASVNSTTGGGAFGASTAPVVLGNTTGSSSNATLNIDQPGVTVANAVNVVPGNLGTKTIGTTITGGSATYSGNLFLNTNATLYAAPGSAELFSGNVNGTGGIILTGGGTITLAGIGSYTGTTLLNNSTLNLNASALGTNTFTINVPVTLDNTSGGSATLANNPPQTWNGDITFSGSSSLNLGVGLITMSANRTVTVNNNVLTVGPIAGAGFGLTLEGPGELSLAGTNSSTYTGGTTNVGGLLAVNGTATFGNGAGPLVFTGGGNLLDASTRAGLPIANPVILNSNTRVYGNSTDTGSPNRYLPFTGPFTVTGGSSLYIDNVGSAKTIFNLSLQGTSYTTVNWPIVIGDPTFDTSGALTVLNFLNDNTTPAETVNGLISGTGSIIRGANTLNTGGTTILVAQNTFTGGVALDSGSLGFGSSSTVSGGAVVSGPIGTGTLTFGLSNNETNLTVFASSGPVEIDNNLFFNGDTNITFGGGFNLLFTGSVNSGNAAKSLTVGTGITTTFSGAITNTGSSGGGPLTKLGTGKLIFSGTNTYIGSTTVKTGTLLVNGVNGTNTVTVNAAGTLGGTGVLSGSLTFSSSGGQAYLYKTAGSPDSPLIVSNNLTLSGNSVTVDLGGTTTLGPGTYNLLTYAGALSGSFSATPAIVNGSLASGNAATIDLSTTNQVNLVVATASTTPPNFPPGGVSLLPTGNISLTATGALGTTYRLWATTNLTLKPVTNTWTLLNSGTISTTPFTNFDLTATNFPQRFYLFTTP